MGICTAGRGVTAHGGSGGGSSSLGHTVLGGRCLACTLSPPFFCTLMSNVVVVRIMYIDSNIETFCGYSFIAASHIERNNVDSPFTKKFAPAFRICMWMWNIKNVTFPAHPPPHDLCPITRWTLSAINR